MIEQKTMLLPLCNYLGMMLVGLIPMKQTGAAAAAAANADDDDSGDDDKSHDDEKESFLAAGEETLESDAWRRDKKGSMYVAVAMVLVEVAVS